MNQAMLDNAQQNFLNLLNTYIGTTGSWIFEFADGKFTATSDFYDIIGYTIEEIDGDVERLCSCFHPDDQSLFQNMLNENISGADTDLNLRIITSTGEVKWIHINLKNVYKQKDQSLMSMGVISDLTGLNKLQDVQKNDIRQLKKQISLMTDEYHDIFEVLDHNGMIKYISPVVEKMYGLKKQDIEKHSIWDLSSDSNRDYLKTLFENCVSHPEQSFTGSIKTIGMDGEEIVLALTMKNYLADAHINGVVIYWKNITSSVNSEYKINQLMKYDDTTELPNRTFFKETLNNFTERLAGTKEKFAVYIIDIGNIKAVSSIISFEYSDELIKLVSMAIKTALADYSVFLSRFFGDQFGLIAEGIEDSNQAYEIAEKIKLLFNESFILNGYESFLDANIGFSIYPDDSMESDTLIKFAQIALSRTMETDNQGIQAYMPVLDIKSFKDFTLRNDLKKAILNNELEVYYQPIVNLNTCDIIAAEALIRWNHPEWGVVSPNEFIPIAETSGLIISIGKWILNEVCGHYKQLMQNGHKNIKISINYSAVQFYEVDFATKILETISRHSITPSFMILEITESVLVNKNKQIDAELNKLKSNGIKIALDDFGTGYSSLTYLSSMDVDVLKLDRGFIDSISNDLKSEKILVSIISLARDLGLRLVAEGISEQVHLDFLRVNHCFSGQGYYFSKPQKYNDFLKILEKRTLKPASELTHLIIPEDEQRKTERISFTEYLEAYITIIEINKKQISVGQTKAQVRDISIHGLSFITSVKFPVKSDIVLRIDLAINKTQHLLDGTILWAEDLGNERYLYGLEFIEDVEAYNRLEDLIASMTKAYEKKNILNIFDEIEASNKLPLISDDIKCILELLYEPAELNIELLALKVSESKALNQLLLDNINSGYFKISKKVSTIEEAIILIGMKAVQNLIVYFITKLTFDVNLERETRKFDIHHYWRHVLGTSVAAQLISKKINKGDKYMLFTYGLVHDIGIPILDNCLPDKLDLVTSKIEKGTHQIVAEKIELNGLTHADIGAWICKKLKFRNDITDIVKHHHTPLLSENQSIDTMIMYVADVMSSQNNNKLLGYNSNYEVSDKVLANIGLSKKEYDAISKTLSQEIERVGTYFKL